MNKMRTCYSNGDCFQLPDLLTPAHDDFYTRICTGSYNCLIFRVQLQKVHRKVKASSSVHAFKLLWVYENVLRDVTDQGELCRLSWLKIPSQ